MRSLRFVAPMANTSPRSPTPSSSVRSAATTESVTLFVDDPRTGARASSSSKKMIEGATVFARANTSRTPRSDSPTHLSRSSAPLTEKNAAPLSWARARMTNVLPVPGGPWRRIPFGASIPMRAKRSGSVSCQITDSVRTCFTSTRFATLSKP